jgi:tRNA threonylcarbamoyladenosine biosynthesis protein TsaE
MKKHTTRSPEETQKLAAEIAVGLKPASVIALMGDLGAGKTCFVQGLARALQVPKKFYVNSPTFTILNIYKGLMPIYHFDFYRLGSEAEAWILGLDDYHFATSVCVIEWAEKFPKYCPKWER